MAGMAENGTNWGEGKNAYFSGNHVCRLDSIVDLESPCVDTGSGPSGLRVPAVYKQLS